MRREDLGGGTTPGYLLLVAARQPLQGVPQVSPRRVPQVGRVAKVGAVPIVGVQVVQRGREVPPGQEGDGGVVGGAAAPEGRPGERRPRGVHHREAVGGGGGQQDPGLRGAVAPRRDGVRPARLRRSHGEDGFHIDMLRQNIDKKMSTSEDAIAKRRCPSNEARNRGMVDRTDKTWRHGHSRKRVVVNNPSWDPDDDPWDGKPSLSALQGKPRPPNVAQSSGALCLQSACS